MFVLASRVYHSFQKFCQVHVGVMAVNLLLSTNEIDVSTIPHFDYY